MKSAPNEILSAYMSTRVVVSQSLCTSKTFKQRIGGQDHFLDLLDRRTAISRNCSNVLHDSLCSLCFAGTGFTTRMISDHLVYHIFIRWWSTTNSISLPDNDTLVLLVTFHMMIRRLSDGENVWWHLSFKIG